MAVYGTNGPVRTTVLELQVTALIVGVLGTSVMATVFVLSTAPVTASDELQLEGRGTRRRWGCSAHCWIPRPGWRPCAGASRAARPSRCRTEQNSAAIGIGAAAPCPGR